MGGEKGKELQITDKRYVNAKRTFVEKIGFLGKEFYLSWQDEDSIYLPESFAYFPTKQLNEMLYYWLVAMASKVDIKDEKVLKQNIEVSLLLTSKYSGFSGFYNFAIKYLSDTYEQLLFSFVN